MPKLKDRFTLKSSLCNGVILHRAHDHPSSKKGQWYVAYEWYVSPP